MHHSSLDIQTACNAAEKEATDRVHHDDIDPPPSFSSDSNSPSWLGVNVSTHPTNHEVKFFGKKFCAHSDGICHVCCKKKAPAVLVSWPNN